MADLSLLAASVTENAPPAAAPLDDEARARERAIEDARARERAISQARDAVARLERARAGGAAASAGRTRMRWSHFLQRTLTPLAPTLSSLIMYCARQLSQTKRIVPRKSQE